MKAYVRTDDGHSSSISPLPSTIIRMLSQVSGLCIGTVKELHEIARKLFRIIEKQRVLGVQMRCSTSVRLITLGRKYRRISENH
jgi:CRISPR/Cas system-associated protein Cas5 (RAMP superfamily)